MTAPHATIQGVLSGERVWGVACTSVLDGLAMLPDNSIHMVVTSPPYYALRSYLPNDHPDKGKEIGSEASPAEYIDTMVRVFREVRRVLRADGTCWVNLGDSFGHGTASARQQSRTSSKVSKAQHVAQGARHGGAAKQLLMMPARVAIALQEDGWWIRSEIVWCKRAPMPESCTDRPTRATERIYLLTKSARYFYDADAVRVPLVPHSADLRPRIERKTLGMLSGARDDPSRNGHILSSPLGRNAWDYWLLSPESFKGEHWAAYPTEIPRRAILAGTSAYGCCNDCGSPYRRVVDRALMGVDERRTDNGMPGRTGNGLTRMRAGDSTTTTTGWERTCRCDTDAIVSPLVLDPFAGSGTSILVALRLGRRGLGIELSPDYVSMAERRIISDAPLFRWAEVSA